MKAWIAAVGLAALSGCGVELLTATAIQSDLQAQQASTLTRQLNQVKESTALTSAKHAIQTYQAEKGVLPPSLEALVPGHLPEVPRQPDGTPFYYNSVTGQVLDSPAPTPEDRQTVAQIHNAINAYGTAVGFYPPSLDALVPQYLPVSPRTAAGEAFLYNNQNGEVVHPRASMATAGAPAPARGGGVSGGGPMGEAMTGIAIQNDLNSMSQGGANAAGSRARSGARDFGAAQTDRQNAAMDSLGL